MNRIGTGTRPRDRGAAEALGLVMIFPVMVLFMLLVVSIGRRIDSTAQARSAAEAAAQAAALQRSRAAGERAMRDVIALMLDASRSCVEPLAELDWSYPVAGQAGRASVTLTCTRPADGLELVKAADEVFAVHAVAAIDPLRATADLPDLGP